MTHTAVTMVVVEQLPSKSADPSPRVSSLTKNPGSPHLHLIQEKKTDRNKKTKTNKKTKRHKKYPSLEPPPALTEDKKRTDRNKKTKTNKKLSESPSLSSLTHQEPPPALDPIPSRFKILI